MIKLSILVCRMPQRYKMWDLLEAELKKQMLPYGDEVELLTDKRTWVTIGQKRNYLMEAAKGEYVCFIDDDDWISVRYVENLIDAISTGCDCASLKGIITMDGANEDVFEHSIEYNSWKTNPINYPIRYERFPNHLNCIKSSIAKQFMFTPKNHGEDFDWSTLLHHSGLIQSEYHIPEVIYYYRYLTNKKQAMSYSQNSEDLFIAEYFADKRNGRFIDIGAYDTFRFSNVRKLYEDLEWGGILAEPAPSNFKSISENYANDNRVIVLNIAIGETTGEIDFYDCNGDAISTTDEAHKAKWEAGGVKYTKIKVQQVSVVDFFNTYGHDADFLSIDTEATNMIIFRNIPEFVWERISMVCVEHDNMQTEIEYTLAKFGFNTLHVNSENIILGK